MHAEYNKKMQNMVKNLKRFYASAATAIVFIEYDAWRYFDNLLDNPNDFGMTDTHSFCPDW